MACACGFFPCVCVHSTDESLVACDATDGSHALISGGENGLDREARERADAKAKLRKLFAANATAQCMMCMIMPCICPAEEDMALGGDEETTSVEAASPLGSESCHDDDDEIDEIDAFGRVRLANDVWVAKELKRFLKPHQVEGVHFLQQHISANRGCILADYMGLGKTMQVVTVIYSYIVDQLMVAQSSNATTVPPATAIVLCPAICIPNWEAEFTKWLSAESRARCPIFALDTTSSKSSTTSARLRRLHAWKRTGGVLLMGYEMFRSLLNPTLGVAAAGRDATLQVCTHVGDSTMEITNAVSSKAQKAAREFYTLLCQPGADLVVLDEGHRMKDPTSLLCQSVAKIASTRRLVLTGYPVQNSLMEYWCMVNFARDGFLGTYDAFRTQYEKPIVDGDVAKSKELIEKLTHVVLRRGQALLKKQLPPKREWILYCKLSPIQHRLYCDFLATYSDASDSKAATADLLSAYALLLQVMNHPDIIRAKLFPDGHDELEEDDDDGSGDLFSASLDSNSGWNWEPEEKLAEKRLLAVEQSRKRKQKLSDRQKALEWARPVFATHDSNNSADTDAQVPRKRLASQQSLVPPPPLTTPPYETMVLEHSGKMAMLLRIVEESFACGDKVVVFSQSVPTLKIISDFLRASAFSPGGQRSDAAGTTATTPANKLKRRKPLARPNRDPAGILRKRKSGAHGSDKRRASAAAAARSTTIGDWFLQIDGSTTGAKRMEYIETFSAKDSGVQLLLVSTRAGAEGINLHAANRLVLFDVSWNPSNDHQSMCRSHRIGQGKTVHVYRLVSTGTMERMIYEQQMKKVDLSSSVVDSLDGVSTAAAARASAAAAATAAATTIEADAGARFSGFLQPPSAQELAEPSRVDASLVDDDYVLAACVEKAGHWLVDIHAVHDMDEDTNSNDGLAA